MATLVSDIRRLKRELLDAGGATIETPEPPAGTADDFQLAARTVVQPDGDLLFFVAETYLAEPDVRQLHAARVSAWFAGLERIVTGGAVALRRAARLLTAAVAVASGLASRQSIASGLAVLVVTSSVALLVQGGLRLALGHSLRRHGA